MSMITSTIFTQDFYKAFYDAVVEAGQIAFNYEYVCEGKNVPIDFEVGDLYVTCEAHYMTTLHDESFDHPFGTWQDPMPYLEVTGCDRLANVKVYESSDRDSTEVAGFDYEEFWRANK